LAWANGRGTNSGNELLVYYLKDMQNGGFLLKIVKKKLLTEHAIAEVISNVSYVVKFHTLEKVVTWLFEK
jgi:hypothetical protein